MSRTAIIVLILAAVAAYYLWNQQQAIAASATGNTGGPGGVNGISSGNTGAVADASGITGATGSVTAMDIIPGVQNPTPQAISNGPSAVTTPNTLINGVNPSVLGVQGSQVAWLSGE